MSENALGRFGHNPNPALDFCIEVDEIEAIAHDGRLGLDEALDLMARVEKAMQFRIGGDLGAINAKARLREVEAALS